MTNVSEKNRLSPVGYAGLLLIVALVAHIGFREAGLPPGHGLRVAATVVLVATMLAFVAAQVAVLRSHDEFHRQVHVTAVSIAFPVALVLVFAVGYLRGEGFFGGADPRDLWLLLLLPYALGFALSWRRYR